MEDHSVDKAALAAALRTISQGFADAAAAVDGNTTKPAQRKTKQPQASASTEQETADAVMPVTSSENSSKNLDDLRAEMVGVARAAVGRGLNDAVRAIVQGAGGNTLKAIPDDAIESTLAKLKASLAGAEG